MAWFGCCLWLAKGSGALCGDIRAQWFCGYNIQDDDKIRQDQKIFNQTKWQTDRPTKMTIAFADLTWHNILFKLSNEKRV